MEKNIEILIHELSFRVRLYRLLTSAESKIEDLTDRELLILEIISIKENMSISDIAALYPKVSGSTISTTITKLWKDKKLVNKTILPENQRVTIVNLTAKGKQVVEQIKKTDAMVYSTITKSFDIPIDYNEFIENIIERSIEFFDRELGLR
ncbi:MarR family winged helix-turn-helix transcriptional regulator [Thermodesulfobacteriota bacterium]